MRRYLVAAALLAACIPEEPDWLVTEPRFRGIRVEVVEPGGYASLLRVPPGKYRATVLPLDTVELTWNVAVPSGDELPPPIWIACAGQCIEPSTDYAGSIQWVLRGTLTDCPHPLPLGLAESCRLGEGPRIRVGLGGAFSFANDEARRGPTVIVVGSRRADLAPSTCLERLVSSPIAPAHACLFSLARVTFGPAWAALPFDPEPMVTPEIRDQEVDTNPDVAGFAITRERGDTRIELVAGVGDDVPVRRGDRIMVAPIFVPGSAQEYWVMVGVDEDVPGSGTPEIRQEQLEWRGWFSAPVDAHVPPLLEWDNVDLSWVVPHDVVPTTLYLDVQDDRAGTAFAELRFVAEDPAR